MLYLPKVCETELLNDAVFTKEIIANYNSVETYIRFYKNKARLSDCRAVSCKNHM